MGEKEKGEVVGEQRRVEEVEAKKERGEKRCGVVQERRW